MSKLDCNVVNCAYNSDNCCRRSDIMVEGTKALDSAQTNCGSFKLAQSEKSVNSTGQGCKETNVSCQAVECRFNQSNKCTANHIGISGLHAGESKETICASFEPR